MDGSDTKRYGDQAKETARSPTLRRTRFVCVSDTHNHAVKLPKGDVLIHAGDLTNQGTSSELIKAVQWLEKADFEAKIVVAGTNNRCPMSELVVGGGTIVLTRLFVTPQGITISRLTQISTRSMESTFTISAPSRPPSALTCCGRAPP